MYLVLIVYASLFPFSNWRDIGLAPWAFFSMPLPYYWTKFDVATNIVGYIPFGALTVFALYPRVRGLVAVIAASVTAAVLCGSMEAIQTFLPNRVPSNLDFYANSGGGFVGAMLGVLTTRTFLQESRLLRIRKAWFSNEAGPGIIVAALWTLAQIYPQAHAFGHGQVLPVFSRWASYLLETEVELATLLRGDINLSIQDYWLGETLISAMGLAGALLAWTCLLRPAAPRRRLLILLAAAAVTIKLLAYALLFTPAHALDWITPGAKAGLVLGLLLALGVCAAPVVTQRRIAIVCLLISVATLNLMPDNPYFAQTLQSWIQGKFLNFNGAAHFLSLFWPYLALWFLVHPAHRSGRN